MTATETTAPAGSTEPKGHAGEPVPVTKPVKEFSLSPVLWLVYFNQYPDVYSELVGCLPPLPLKPAARGLTGLSAQVAESTPSSVMGPSGVRLTPEEVAAQQQEAAEQNLAESKAAAAVLDPHLGELQVFYASHLAGHKGFTTTEAEMREDLRATHRNHATAGGHEAATEIDADSLHQLNQHFTAENVAKVCELAGRGLVVLCQEHAE